MSSKKTGPGASKSATAKSRAAKSAASKPASRTARTAAASKSAKTATKKSTTARPKLSPAAPKGGKSAARTAAGATTAPGAPAAPAAAAVRAPEPTRIAGQPAATRVFDHALNAYRPIRAGEPGAGRLAAASPPAVSISAFAHCACDGVGMCATHIDEMLRAHPLPDVPHAPAGDRLDLSLDAALAGVSRASAALRADATRRPVVRTPEFERAVRERAYFCWLESGCPEGRAQDHWAQAERDILAHSSLGL